MIEHPRPKTDTSKENEIVANHLKFNTLDLALTLKSWVILSRLYFTAYLELQWEVNSTSLIWNLGIPFALWASWYAFGIRPFINKPVGDEIRKKYKNQVKDAIILFNKMRNNSSYTMNPNTLEYLWYEWDNFRIDDYKVLPDGRVVFLNIEEKKPSGDNNIFDDPTSITRKWI